MKTAIKYIDEVKLWLKSNVTELKYFSTDGSNRMPNGVGYQRGMYMHECFLNKQTFITNNNDFFITKDLDLVKGIDNKQYNLPNYKGGILVFSTDGNTLDISKNKLSNWLKKQIKTFGNKIFSQKDINHIGSFSIGNFFKGIYIANDGKRYNENSMTFEINGIKSKTLIYLAEEIGKQFKQKKIIVKDLNSNKMYSVDMI